MVDTEEHGAGGRHALWMAHVDRLEEEPEPEAADGAHRAIEAVHRLARRSHVDGSAHHDCRRAGSSSFALARCSRLTELATRRATSLAREILARLVHLGARVAGTRQLDQLGEVLPGLVAVAGLRGGLACPVQAAIAVGLALLRGLVLF